MSVVEVRRVNGYCYEVRRDGVVVDAGLLRPVGSLFAAYSDATPSRSKLRASSSRGVLERLAESYGGTVADR